MAIARRVARRQQLPQHLDKTFSVERLGHASARR